MERNPEALLEQYNPCDVHPLGDCLRIDNFGVTFPTLLSRPDSPLYTWITHLMLLSSQDCTLPIMPFSWSTLRVVLLCKQERVDKGDAKDVAKGFGIFTAKFVANKSRNEPNDTAIPDGADPKWKWLDGDQQTDFEFDLSVMHHMGPEFYRDVFMPAIAAARAEGKKYEDVRNTIRETWKPAKKKR